MQKLMLLLLVTTLGCAVRKSMPLQFADNPVVAHRGAFKSGGLPENSIAALREAIRLGCTGSEFDIWLTADDSLVVNHDPVYHKLDIEKTAYKELRRLLLPNGEPLPLLRNYLATGMTGNRQTRLVLEIKPSRLGKERAAKLAEAVFAMVRSVGAEQYVSYISFDLEVLKQIIRLDGSAETQYLNGELSPAELKALRISGVDYHYSVFRRNPSWIQEAKRHGLRLNAWTVNDPAEMDWLLDQGFDYVTTNEPELLLSKWKQRKK